LIRQAKPARHLLELRERFEQLAEALPAVRSELIAGERVAGRPQEDERRASGGLVDRFGERIIAVTVGVEQHVEGDRPGSRLGELTDHLGVQGAWPVEEPTILLQLDQAL